MTSGIYSKVRHPGYLGLILVYFGLATVFGVIWMLIPAAIFSVSTYFTAVEEDKVLERRFREEYYHYIRRVPWRFVPRVF